jgi:hypothetical protein
MKTMLNRTFYINDAFKHSSVSKLEQLSYIALVGALDTARTALNQQLSVESGEREQYEWYDNATARVYNWALNDGKLTGKVEEGEMGEMERIVINSFGVMM